MSDHTETFGDLNEPNPLRSLAGVEFAPRTAREAQLKGRLRAFSESMYRIIDEKDGIAEALRGRVLEVEAQNTELSGKIGELEAQLKSVGRTLEGALAREQRAINAYNERLEKTKELHAKIAWLTNREAALREAVAGLADEFRAETEDVPGGRPVGPEEADTLNRCAERLDAILAGGGQ